MEKEKSTKSEEIKGGGTTAYDVVLFLARSLGRALPAVVIVGLIAYGAWFAIRETSRLETAVIEAERKQSEAERNAAAAADKAKLEALQKYSDQLNELNKASEEVSRKLQDLVSGQLDNMKKAEVLSRDQELKARQLQEQIENISKDKLAQSQDELNKLQKQIEDARKESEDKVLAAKVASYKELIQTITSRRMNYGQFQNSDVIELLLRSLDDSRIEHQAEQDLANNDETWQVRFVLAVQLFRKTSNPRYIDALRSIVQEHKTNLESALSLLTEDHNFNVGQRKLLLPFLADFVLDSEATDGDRNELIQSSMLSLKEAPQILGTERTTRVARVVGKKLVDAVKQNSCYQIFDYVRLLNALSPEAALVYGSRAGQDPTVDNKTQNASAAPNCRSLLESALQGIPKGTPTSEMMQKWP